jgi:unsaturated chondroitin disaccharide hydrolase
MSIPNDLYNRYKAVFDIASAQLRRLISEHPNQFPMYTTHGKWDFTGESWTNWCEGFLGGQIWLVYLHNRDPWWREQAECYARLIEPRKTDRNVHDLGFLFFPTWKRWYELTDDPDIQAVVIEAGRTLALRYNEKGKYLRSFLAPDSLFIDIMMNVGIIFYAAQHSGDHRLHEIAIQHCLTTRRYLVRGDGSTAHEGIFDLETGAFLRQSTQQGWRVDSCWARGLAWALYGFTTVFGFTQDTRFLDTARSCADYFLCHVPEHGVPPNDFDEPAPANPYESSAAAIAASGLLDLSVWSGESRYHDSAVRILDTLARSEFLADPTSGWEGLLKHGIYHQRKGLGVDESVMWGDYFFLEAVWKVLHE